MSSKKLLFNGGAVSYGKVLSKNANKLEATVQRVSHEVKTPGYAAPTPMKEPGRILRRQMQKDAFTLGNRNGVELSEIRVKKLNPNIKLTTSDNFLEKFRQMYPDKSAADIMKQKMQHYKDLCYLFGKINIK